MRCWERRRRAAPVVQVGTSQDLAAVSTTDADLEQSLADTLHHSAMDLCFDDEWVEHRSDIVDSVMAASPISPLSLSISTSAIWQPPGKVKFVGS
jgi:hypothetical protein